MQNVLLAPSRPPLFSILLGKSFLGLAHALKCSTISSGQLKLARWSYRILASSYQKLEAPLIGCIHLLQSHVMDMTNAVMINFVDMHGLSLWCLLLYAFAEKIWEMST